MKIFLSAAEASSDLHGAKLLEAIQVGAKSRGVSVEAIGIGGPRLLAQGLRPLAHSKDLLAMGFGETLSRLGSIRRAFDTLAQAIEREKPDTVILIDYPEFHLRLRKKFLGTGLKTKWIYYIPPKVWVWREKRAEFLKSAFDLVLSIFPFEDRDFQYVGNPLIDELPLGLSREEARGKVGVADLKTPVLLLMPGSRPAELKMHSQMMVQAALAVKERFKREGRGELKIHVALPEIADLTQEAYFKEAGVSVSRGDSSLWLKASDAALVKSGTSTLEAALLDCPHALVYKTNVLSSFLFKYVIRFKGPVGLVNLLLAYDSKNPAFFRSKDAPRATHEIVLEAVTVERLTTEAYELLTSEPRRKELKGAFERLRDILKAGGKSPSQNAAEKVLGIIA